MLHVDSILRAARSARFMLLIAAAAAGLAGCSKETAPASTASEAPANASDRTAAPAGETATTAAAAAPAVAAADVAIPPTSELDDPNLLAFVRLREPSKSFDRMGAWQDVFPPSASPAAMRMQLQQMGLDLAQLRAGGNLGVFVYKNAQPNMPPEWAAIIPAPESSAFSGQAATMFANNLKAAAGQDTVIASSAAALASAQAGVAKLTAFNDAALESDIQMNLNFPAIMASYGVQARGFLPMLPMFLGSAGPEAVQMLQVQAGGALDLADQIQAVAMNLSFEPTAAEASSVLKPKAGSTLGGFIGAQRPADPALAGYIAGTHHVEMVAAVDDVNTLAGTYKKYLGQLFPADQAAERQQMEAAMDKWAALGAISFAGGYNFTGEAPGAPMTFEGVVKSAKPDEAIALARESIALYNSGAMKSMMQGTTITAELKQAVRTVEGSPVDQIMMTFHISPDLPGPQAEMLKKMWGDKPVAIEFAKVKELLVVSFGKPLEGVASRVAAGSATAQMAGLKAFGPGASFLMDMDVMAYLQAVFSAMGAGAPPITPPPASPVSMAAYQSGNTAYYRLNVPKDLVLALTAMVQAQQGAAQQQMMQMQQPGQPGMQPGFPPPPGQ